MERVKKLKLNQIKPFDKELYDLINKRGGCMAQIMLGQVPNKAKMKHQYNFQKDADGYIYVCPKCNSCWEFIHEGWKQRSMMGKISIEKITKVNYYDDFPRMGKTKKICSRCL